MQVDQEVMAKVIAEQSLDKIRRYPDGVMDHWYHGRSSAAALMYPCVETLSAYNEIGFLIKYNRRHGNV